MRARRSIGVGLLWWQIFSGIALAEAQERSIQGTAVDASGGLLPGVTVMARGRDGRVLATTVTDGRGKYAFERLSKDSVSLKFELAGFAETVVDLSDQMSRERPIVRLELARLGEGLVVREVARAEVLPSRPALIPVPDHNREGVCGPAKAETSPQRLGTIQVRHQLENGLHATGDELAIAGGTLDGLHAGQNLVVRRRFDVKDGARTLHVGEHTAGLVQIMSADERSSTALVVYACDEMMAGDYLAPFVPELARAPEPVGQPAYRDAARILFADAGQIIGAPRRLMVIDRGSDAGLRVAQRLTIFRRDRHLNQSIVVGDAVVVSVRAASATIRIEQATDAIAFGDWAAPHELRRH